MESNVESSPPRADLDAETRYRLHRRFDRMGRLVGDAGMQTLFGSRVLVVGLGGVGSWAAESLVRAGVGHVTLVDFDEICVTNFNRQLHALQGEVGKKKAVVLADRLKRINPQAEIVARPVFYSDQTSDELFADRPDYVIDAIDHITAKCHLLARCRRDGIPVVTSTGSGGRLDPTRVQVTDLNETQIDPLAKDIRRILREKYDFPMKGHYGISAVWSPEQPTKPLDLSYDGGLGFRCVCPQGDNGVFTCDNRNLIMGNAGFVTGAFGLAAASTVVRGLLSTPTQT